MRTMFQQHIQGGIDILEADDHKESWRMYRAQAEEWRREMDDPEAEIARKEQEQQRQETFDLAYNLIQQFEDVLLDLLAGKIGIATVRDKLKALTATLDNVFSGALIPF